MTAELVQHCAQLAVRRSAAAQLSRFARREESVLLQLAIVFFGEGVVGVVSRRTRSETWAEFSGEGEPVGV
jgi:hypothetical protein